MKIIELRGLYINFSFPSLVSLRTWGAQRGTLNYLSSFKISDIYILLQV